MKLSPVTRRGNKNRLIHETGFISFFPRFNHRLFYIEPFAGTCEVALHYLDQARTMYNVTLNDSDGELINFWKVLAQHPVEFEERVKPVFLGITLDENDDIDRAINFWARSQRSVHLSMAIRPRKHFDQLVSILNRHKVIFTQHEWKKSLEVALKLNPREEMVFYLDPPYFNTDAGRRPGPAGSADLEGYGNLDHDEMAAFLNGIKDDSRIWIFLSHHDCEFIRAAYDGWHFMELKMMGDSGRAHLKRPRMELLISNRSFMRWGDQALDNFVGG